MDYERVTSYGNLMRRGLEDMHRGRLLRYLRGEMNEFCAGCDYCADVARKVMVVPKEIRGGISKEPGLRADPVP